MNKIWLLIGFSALVVSCSTDAGNFTIGESLVNTESSVVMSDTFRVELSTIVLDSINTSSPSTVLVGKYTNPILGTSEFRHFVNFDVSSDISNITEYDILDSITFKMSLSGFYKGDTITPVTFYVHRLTSQLDFPGSGTTEGTLNSDDSFPYDETPMGSFTFIPEPSLDSIEVRLPDSLGQELMQLEIDDSIILDDNEDFNAYLKGFVVIPATETNVALGFGGSSTDIQLKLYHHTVDLGIDEKETTFNISAEGNNFNQTISDRTGTSFEQLTVQTEKLSASLTNNITAIQGSSGLMTKLNFPSLNDIYSYGERVLIRAELLLVPSLDNDMDNLPSTLNFYASDKQNTWGATLSTTSSTGAAVAVSATLVSNYVSGKHYYIANVTDFLLDELEGNYYNTDNGLIVGFPSTNMAYKADYLFLSGKSVNQLDTKLNLYFLRYE